MPISKYITNYKQSKKELEYNLKKTISILIHPLIPFDLKIIQYLNDDRIYFELEFSSIGMTDIDIEQIEKLGFRMIQEIYEYHKPHTYLFKEIEEY